MEEIVGMLQRGIPWDGSEEFTSHKITATKTEQSEAAERPLYVTQSEDLHSKQNTWHIKATKGSRFQRRGGLCREIRTFLS
ncbi:hypothetical protein KUCAC02_029170 [Chaenocephalus aceratus]|uniref:Uncharacterized protein n=1 Tax=Chaenocephalus aceratus TaxID=36190 RepID=A0ACB9X562_CHAAC|nr:hypothetical protein KUCAC02_029170 [Chaenocephalus aceratus]